MGKLVNSARQIALLLLLFVVGSTPTPPQDVPAPGRSLSDPSAALTRTTRAPQADHERFVSAGDLPAIDTLPLPPSGARLRPGSLTSRIEPVRPRTPRLAQGPPV